MDFRFRVRVVFEFPREVLFVRDHVEISVTANADQDHALLALGLRIQSGIDATAQCVGWFRRRHDALGPCEPQSRLERLNLGIGDRLDMPTVHKLAEKRRGAVVAKATRVDSWWNEVVSKRVHLHDWGVADGITVVKGVDALGEGWARRWFARDNLGLGASCKVLANEWEGKACEVAATSDTSVDLVRIFAGKVELAQCFLPDDCLMHEYMVQD